MKKSTCYRTRSAFESTPLLDDPSNEAPFVQAYARDALIPRLLAVLLLRGARNLLGWEQRPMARATSRSKSRNKQQGIYLKIRPIKLELTRRLIIVPIAAQRASEARPARAMCTGGGPAFPRFGVRPGPRLIRSACEGPDVAPARTRRPQRIGEILLQGGGSWVENPPYHF